MQHKYFNITRLMCVMKIKLKVNKKRALEKREKWKNIKRPLSWNVDVYWIDRWENVQYGDKYYYGDIVYTHHGQLIIEIEFFTSMFEEWIWKIIKIIQKRHRF